MVLGLFDTVFCAASVVDAILQVHFPSTERVLFPYLLWPTLTFSLVASQFMLVAIAAERFTAVLRPDKYKNFDNRKIVMWTSGIAGRRFNSINFCLPIFQSIFWKFLTEMPPRISS